MSTGLGKQIMEHVLCFIIDANACCLEKVGAKLLKNCVIAVVLSSALGAKIDGSRGGPWVFGIEQSGVVKNVKTEVTPGHNRCHLTSLVVNDGIGSEGNSSSHLDGGEVIRDVPLRRRWEHLAFKTPQHRPNRNRASLLWSSLDGGQGGREDERNCFIGEVPSR
eukprot:GFKZ01004141.1.p1 GENE.GFKZ01004141.1~~GFKZ01004141.1.p1  ORF type:complete len:164 (+),score=8.62 GFKZ01004141.1:403-894(+)